MRLTKILAIAAVVGSFTVTVQPGLAVAKITEQQPAEFPASSYKGKQYVDSKGCVFIRAGIDGNVSWVPRVTRDRKTVCGFKPSNAGRAVAAAPVRAPAEITLNTDPAPVAKPKAKAAPRRVAQATKPRRAAPVVVRQTAKRPVAVPKPPVVTTAVAPSAAKVRRTKAALVTGGCQGASAISARYLRGTGVRCGPQTQPIVGNHFATRPAPVVAATNQRKAAVKTGSVTQGGIARVAEVTATTRIVPKHVAVNRVNTRNVSVPRGYRPVWDDDRLNPKRAEQNLQGRADMLLVWTQTLPRRLINQSTGRDVTASVPLIYPYTSVVQQRQDLGEVTIVQRDGQTVKRVVRHAKGKALKKKPVYSSRSTPKVATAKVVKQKAAASPALAGKRYVQVGTFNNPANARRTAQKIAGMGMAARIGKHRKGGKTYMTVQAGPFKGAAAMRSAMKRLRGAGYADAFAR